MRGGDSHRRQLASRGYRLDVLYGGVWLQAVQAEVDRQPGVHMHREETEAVRHLLGVLRRMPAVWPQWSSEKEKISMRTIWEQHPQPPPNTWHNSRTHSPGQSSTESHTREVHLSGYPGTRGIDKQRGPRSSQPGPSQDIKSCKYAGVYVLLLYCGCCCCYC